jgi:hypothetical protein
VADTKCVYRERERACHEAVAMTVKIGGRESPLCERHLDPRFWPPDLRKRLPGRLRRGLRHRG